MEKISKFDLSSSLEECIACLQSGKSLEETLKKYPEHIDELRPLVETAYIMRSAANQQQTITPAARVAQARSRNNFIRMANAPASQPSFFSFLHLRLVTTLMIFAILLFGLLGSHLAAVSALPGDPFYPVKLAIEQVQVNLAPNPEQRIQRMESYDQRRVEDVNRLKNLGRQVEVDFTGTLEDQDDTWFVSGIRLIGTPDLEAKFMTLKAMDVEVRGFSNGETLEVNEIHAHTFTIQGTIQKIEDNIWTVDGIAIHTNDDTKINGQPQVGSSIDLSIHRLESDELLAISVKVNIQAPIFASPQPSSTRPYLEHKPEPTEGETAERIVPTRRAPSDTQTSAPPAPSKTADQEENHGSSSATPVPTHSDEHTNRVPTATRTISRSSSKTATDTPSDEEHHSTNTPVPSGEH